MNPTLMNMLANAAPHVARYAGAHRLAPATQSYGAPTIPTQEVSFGQASRFGNLNTSVVLATTLAGYAFDKQITDTLKVPGGWGPVIGAVLGLTATNTIAGLSQGLPASAGYAVGGVTTLIPTALAAYALNKTTSDKTTVTVLTALAGLNVAVSIARGLTR